MEGGIIPPLLLYNDSKSKVLLSYGCKKKEIKSNLSSLSCLINNAIQEIDILRDQEICARGVLESAPFTLEGCNGLLTQVPHHFFLIWLGMLSESQLVYPKVWVKTGLQPIIYYDGSACLAGFYRKEMLDFALSEGRGLVDVQNSFYDFFMSGEYGSCDFAFIDFLKIKCKRDDISAKYEKMLSTYSVDIDKNFKFINVNTFGNLFFREEFRRFYLYEIILRNNLAAASDILRLLILYRLGGVYVDFDTLPDFSYIFSKMNSLVYNTEINRNIVDIVKSEGVLSIIDKEHTRPYRDDILNACISYVEKTNENILNEMKNDLSLWNGELEKFEFPYAYKHVGKISASKNNLSEYNNNMLAAHAGSKGISIIFREMIRRYNYLESYGYLLSHKPAGVDESFKDGYLARLNAYRLDGTNESDNVTLILTGPSFLLEVILGLSYILLSINKEISPLAISYALREQKIGIGFEYQTMFTLEHVQSSWM